MYIASIGLQPRQKQKYHPYKEGQHLGWTFTGLAGKNPKMWSAENLLAVLEILWNLPEVMEHVYRCK